MTLMVGPKHLEILASGDEVWNVRREVLEVHAEIRGHLQAAEPGGVHLSGLPLNRALLVKADLNGVGLGEAELISADFHGGNLSSATKEHTCTRTR